MPSRIVLLMIVLLPGLATAQERQRAREIGLKVGVLSTGTYNAITDVKGVKVGHVTSGKLMPCHWTK